MKRHLFYGIMGRDKSNINKQYTSKRQYIVACLQFFRKENFSDVSFGNIRAVWFCCARMALFFEKHRPEDILACLKRHVQDMKNVIRGVSMGKGRPGKGGKPADKELSLLVQKRLANERCLWTCPRCGSRRTLSNKFCANCCHYRPWDEDAEDLDMSRHYQCTGPWCNQPLLIGTEECSNCGALQGTLGEGRKPESSSESSSSATSKSRRKSSSSSSASSGNLTTHMLTGKKQLKTIQYETDDPGVYGQAKLIDRHPTHWTFSAYPHDRPLYAAEDPDRVPTGVTIYEADGSLFAWQPPFFGNSLYVNSVVGRQSEAAICLRVRVLCKDVWHGRKHKWHNYLLPYGFAVVEAMEIRIHSTPSSKASKKYAFVGCASRTLGLTFQGSPQVGGKKFVKDISLPALVASYKNKGKTNSKFERAYRPIMLWDLRRYMMMDRNLSQPYVRAVPPEWWDKDGVFPQELLDVIPDCDDVLLDEEEGGDCEEDAPVLDSKEEGEVVGERVQKQARSDETSVFADIDAAAPQGQKEKSDSGKRGERQKEKSVSGKGQEEEEEKADEEVEEEEQEEVEQEEPEAAAASTPLESAEGSPAKGTRSQTVAAAKKTVAAAKKP
eukprot:g68153.t1